MRSIRRDEESRPCCTRGFYQATTRFFAMLRMTIHHLCLEKVLVGRVHFASTFESASGGRHRRLWNGRGSVWRMVPDGKS